MFPSTSQAPVGKTREPCVQCRPHREHQLEMVTGAASKSDEVGIKGHEDDLSHVSQRRRKLGGFQKKDGKGGKAFLEQMRLPIVTFLSPPCCVRIK